MQSLHMLGSFISLVDPPHFHFKILKNISIARDEHPQYSVDVYCMGGLGGGWPLAI